MKHKNWMEEQGEHNAPIIFRHTGLFCPSCFLCKKENEVESKGREGVGGVEGEPKCRTPILTRFLLVGVHKLA